MKNQIEFHCMDTEDAFTLDPDNILMVTKTGKHASLRVTWTTYEFQTEESYETVKRKLLEHYYSNADVRL